MKRLTGLDAGFLWMETPSSGMHVSGLAVYDPSELLATDGTFGIENIRDMVRGRLHLAPPFRQRLVEVPLQLHFPLWIEDPDFDLDRHIRRVGVPAPGGPRELAEVAAHLNATNLNRSRPLWELWYIEGLEGGRVATLTKVHHAAIDGASGSEITVALFDLSSEVAAHPEPDEPWQPDDVPSDLDMVRYAVASLARQPLRVLRALRRTGQAALNVRSVSRTGDHDLAPLPFSAPATSINRAITARRSIATTSLSLPDVKRVKNAFGCTVNDVILTLCGGALRRYFDGRGEALDGPLLAMVPVSVRAEDQRSDMGNQVSSMFTTLATDIDDPVERLLAIHRGMQGAKEQHRALGADTLTDWAEFAAPAVFGRAMRLYARMGLADRHRPAFNLTISNVPGPPFPLYSAGARLEANFPLGPIFDGAALNITVMGLEHSLDVGILTCPDVVDDVWTISDGLAASLEELLAAARLATSSEPGRPDREVAAKARPTTQTVKAGAAKKARAAKAPAKKARAEAPAKKAPPKKARASKARTSKRPT
ncbi:wax ester/triacylglycerol synthase family O-acyltransferase [soil metagenome]